MLVPVGLVKKSPKQSTAEFINKRRQPLSMDEASLSAKTVAELKVLLAEQSLPVSGKKSELVDRLLAGSAVVSLEEKPPISISFDE